MTLVALRKWLVTTPLEGKAALMFALGAIALPTVYRMSLDGIVMGIGYCPYLVFVLLSAIALGWKRAALIAIVSVAVVDALFVGTRFQLIEGPTDMLGDLGFLLVSGLIIALVQAIRTAFEALVGPTSADGVFFSLEGGQVWASWPTAGFHLRLGQLDDVTETMKEFIAQAELGKRLDRSTRSEEARKTSPA
ncbi:MAG TPA: hypothetical protein VFH89_03115 [Sphingomicrobium sp.]|nr:hypothetical protein [Sphingomicrobium sp.]